MVRPAQTLRAALAAVVLMLAGGCRTQSPDRLWVDSAINGQPVHMFADTGATLSMLHTDSAQSLGLAIMPPPPRPDLPPTALNFPLTAPADLQFWNTTMRTRFGVQDFPAFIRAESDGVIGWAELRRKILAIDADAHQIRPLDELPPDLTGWTRFDVFPAREMLILEVPQPGGAIGLIFVDTGNAGGVGLSPDAWRTWRAEHIDAQLTERIYYMAAAKVVTGLQSWASEINIGPLRLTDTPVEECDPMTLGMGGSRHLATFGVAALRRLDFIYDGPHYTAYLRPKDTPPQPFNHNRLGAIVTPQNEFSDNMVAHVVPNTPAAEAGLREGDIVTAINRVTKLNWLKYPDTGLPDFNWGAGTRVQIQVLRGGSHYYLFARLRDLLGPGSAGFQPAHSGH